VEAALAAFRGLVQQEPPMYSALKIEGRRLYELARRGEQVEREARPVFVHDLAIRAYDPPDIDLEMTVTKGTYVRSIAHDLGEALGVGAHLAALRRTAVGVFTLDKALPLERAIDAFREGWWPQALYTLDHALEGMPALVADAPTEDHMRHGRQFSGPAGAAGHPEIRVYSAGGLFLGTARWDPESRRFQPHRVFAAS
jgi:tRNA pseudouridine55 synthase